MQRSLNIIIMINIDLQGVNLGLELLEQAEECHVDQS